MLTPGEMTNFLVLIYGGLLLTAAYTDFRFFKIPNRIVASILILYPAYVVSSPENVAWGASLMAAGVLFVAGLFLFRFGAMGGGDVKLLVAVSLWSGFENYLTMMVVTACVGVLLIPLSAFLTSLKFAKAEAAQSGGAGALAGARTFGSALAGMRFVHLRGHWIPYGVAIAAAGIYIASGMLTF
jgi:prepilin peptidase CpaA